MNVSPLTKATNRGLDSRSSRLGDFVFSTLVALTIVGYPLVAALPELTNLPTRVFSIPFRGVFLCLSLLLIFIAISERTLTVVGRFWFFFLLFWILYFVRLFHDTLLSSSPLGFDVEEYWLFGFGVTFLPAIAFARQSGRRAFMVALYLSLALLLIATTSNLVVGWDNVPDTILFRFSTDSLNPIAVGTTGSRLFILSTFVLIRRALVAESPSVRDVGERHARLLLLALVGLPLGAVSLFISGSRGPIIAALLCLAIALAHLFSRTRNRLVLPVTMVLLVVTVIASALPFVINLGGGVLERFYSTFRLEDLSDIDRFNLWSNGWNQFLDSPFTGSGVEELEYLYYPHNLFLEGYMATGIIGGSLFLLLSAYTVYRATKIYWASQSISWVGLLYLNIWMIALFSGSIWGGGSLIHFMVIVAILSSRQSSRLDRRAGNPALTTAI